MAWSLSREGGLVLGLVGFEVHLGFGNCPRRGFPVYGSQLHRFSRFFLFASVPAVGHPVSNRCVVDCALDGVEGVVFYMYI